MKDDLVRRQAAITAIQKAYADTVGGTDRYAVWKNVGLTNALHIMQDLLQDLPSVQTEKMQLSKEDATKDATFPVDGEPIDCISRQQAILAIERNAYRREDINETEHIIRWVLDIIKWLPSEQPEVIRCEDCKWRRNRNGTMAWIPCRALVTPDDFYCKYAERKEQ